MKNLSFNRFSYFGRLSMEMSWHWTVSFVSTRTTYYRGNAPIFVNIATPSSTYSNGAVIHVIYTLFPISSVHDV